MNSASKASVSETAGLLLEQEPNLTPQIVAKRIAECGGHEASSIATFSVRRWTPTDDAADRLVEDALRSALKPGSVGDVEAAKAFLDEHAVLLRETVRARIVMPLVPEASNQVDLVLASTLPSMNPQNIAAKCEAALGEAFKRVDAFKARIDGEIRLHYQIDSVVERVGAALFDAEASLLTAAAAVAQLRSKADAEPAAIDALLKKIDDQVNRDRQTIRIRCAEIRGVIFGREDAVQKVKAVVQTTVPTLGKARVGAIYLPIVREGMAAVASALDHCRQELDARIATAEATVRLYYAHRAERTSRDSSSSRVRVVGAPASKAAWGAAVESIVQLALPAVRRRMRELISRPSTPERMLEELLAIAREEVVRHVSEQSIDDVLLAGKSLTEVAHALDRLLRSATTPLGLVAGADRARLHGLRCRVVRLPKASRIKQALIESCNYDRQLFAESDALDRIDVLIWQLGVGIEETDVFERGTDDWAEERDDRGAPPVQTLSDTVLGLTPPATAS